MIDAAILSATLVRVLPFENQEQPMTAGRAKIP
jgi:hypothetical protein